MTAIKSLKKNIKQMMNYMFEKYFKKSINKDVVKTFGQNKMMVLPIICYSV